jgi:putative ABC transport system permease protein
MNVIARLGPGASESQADAAMPSLAASLTRDYPSMPRTLAIDAVPLAGMVSDNARQVLFLLLGAVGCLLLIALANVTNLLLVRSASRLNDMAVRTSLGATRWHVVRFMLIESCVLSFGGAFIGLLLTTWTIGIVPTLDLGALPPTARVQIDLMELAGAAALAVAGGLTMGLLPALRISRQAQATQHTPDGARVIDGGGAIRSGIVVLEVALAIVLLVGGGLLARSFWRLMHVEAGFDASRTLTASIAMPATRYPSPERLRAFVDTLLADVRTLPGVERAAFVNRLPLGGGNVLVGVEVAGRPGEPITVDRRVMTDDYFETLGIRLAEGRTFGPQDRADSPERVAIVNAAAARRFWPDGQSLGRQLRLMLQGGPGPWLTVVGVSGDIRHHGLDKPAEAEVYVPFNQAGVNSGVLLVRSGVDPTSLGRAVAERLRRIDPELPLDHIQPMSAVVDRSIATPRLRTLIFNGLGALALLLAATGLFGVLSYLVTIRTRDIGVRIALGAEPRHLFRLVVGGGLKLTAIGAVAGLLASLAAARGLTSVLFGVSPYDPAAFAGASAVLMVVTVMATLLPLRRALALDPVRALRGD